MELSSGLVQGVILGVRKNDLDSCRIQRSVLVAHCVFMLGATLFFRPCGSHMANFFLIASKFGSFITALLVLVHAESGDETASEGGQFATAGFAFVSSIQSVVQLVLAVVLARKSLLSAVRRLLQQKRHVSQEDEANPELGTLDAMMTMMHDETNDEDPLIINSERPLPAAVNSELADVIDLDMDATPQADYDDGESMLDDILADGTSLGDGAQFDVLTDEQIAALSPEERAAYKSFERTRRQMLKSIQRGLSGGMRMRGLSRRLVRSGDGSGTAAAIAYMDEGKEDRPNEGSFSV